MPLPFFSVPHKAFALRHFDHVAVRCLCSSFRALHIFAFAVHFLALRLIAFAIQRQTRPFRAKQSLCTTYRCCSLPLLCNTSLFLSYALCLLAMPLLLNSSHFIATQYRCASTHSELCLCLAIPPLLRNTIASLFYSSLCRCVAEPCQTLRCHSSAMQP